MHTGAKLNGVICKCMVCAHNRQEYLRREALLRYPDEYQQHQRDIAAAEAAAQVVNALLSMSQSLQNELLEEVRQEIVNS